MPRKCPPGTLCIENITLIFLIAVVLFGVFLYNKINSNKSDINLFLNNNLSMKIIVWKAEIVKPKYDILAMVFKLVLALLCLVASQPRHLCGPALPRPSKGRSARRHGFASSIQLTCMGLPTLSATFDLSKDSLSLL